MTFILSTIGLVSISVFITLLTLFGIANLLADAMKDN